jgi:hypothetical protein
MSAWRFVGAACLLCALVLFVAPPARAAGGTGQGQVLWPSGGVPLTTATGAQSEPRLASDGASGAFAAWTDCRNPLTQCDVYGQHVAANGTRLWNVNGLAIGATLNADGGPRLASDGAGGVYVAFVTSQPDRSWVRLAHLDGAGNSRWVGGWRLIDWGNGARAVAQLLPDGAGGVFVIWYERLDPASDDGNLFAQRVSFDGVSQWAAATTITAAPGDQYDARATADGAGGFIVAWADARDPNDQNLYAQRISASGQPLWTLHGVLVTYDASLQRMGPLVADGAGGAFLAWYDFRSNGHTADVYMQRITSGGQRAWAADLAIAANDLAAEGPADLVSDGAGGAILFLTSAVSPEQATEVDVLAQRVNAAGDLLWGPQPVNVTPWPDQQDFPVAVADRRGGAYVAWIDKGSDPTAYDVWAQHVDADGTLVWPGRGVQVVSAPGVQDSLAAVAGGPSDMIVAWQDGRAMPDAPDIYAQRVGDVPFRAYLPVIEIESND